MADTARDRLVRLLGMVAYLEAHGSTEVAVLAEHFGASPDTITRDVWTLATSGVPPYLPDEYLDFDFEALDDGLVVLRESQGVTQVRLSGQEAIALTGALATLIAAGTAPAGAEALLDRIRDAYGGTTPVTVLAGESVDPAVRATLDSAISAQRAVALDYVDAQDRRTERTVEPHRLVAIDGVGYLECWCRRAQGHRTLRLSRIAAASATDEPIAHEASAEPGFSLEARFEAVVEIRRPGRWAFEDIAGAAFEDRDETVVVTFGVANIDWTAARLLAVAPHLVSVEPEPLRDALAQHAGAVAAAHHD